jgi:hypothetical protein
MGAVSVSFYVSVLSHISAPHSVQNLQACNAWEVAEGGSAAHNPWNTTQWEPGATSYNTFGNPPMHVWNYPSESVGVQATVRTLLNGHYPRIVREFSGGQNGLGVCQAVDASPWGTHHAAAVYARLYHPTPRLIRLTNPFMHGPDVVQVQSHLHARGYNPGAIDGIYGPTSYSAVRHFQGNHGLTVDGIVGPATRHALGIS